MKNRVLFLFLVFCGLYSKGQITIIGHNMINNVPITNTKIFIQSEGIPTRSMSTLAKSDFKLQLDYGRLYKVYFQNTRCPVMHIEVAGNGVPRDKYATMMTYEINVPFADRNDDDVDTTVFAKPFHRIIFNGTNKMIEDTVYNHAFSKTILKRRGSEDNNGKPANAEGQMILAGKILTKGDSSHPLEHKQVSLLDKNGAIIKSTQTNRFGAFCFTGIQKNKPSAIKVTIPPNTNADYELLNTKHKKISQGQRKEGSTEFPLSAEETNELFDNNYTVSIGGKLVASSAREKKFFAEKNVYLCNRFNTVLQKTKTNLFGTFVFEDVRPDNRYYISVDKPEIAPGAHIDMLNKEDRFVGSLDSVIGGKSSMAFTSNYNQRYNDIQINDNEMKMDVNATIFGDNVNNPIGRLKILLLNDEYEVIDSAITDNFGTFKFKYLPFLKRFYLSAENNDNILDVFKNILIYSSDANLIKIMTHQKGTKFTYKPVNAEMVRMRDIELEDPWLELISEKPLPVETPSTVVISEKGKPGKYHSKLIVENILFENNKSDIMPQAKEVLDKVILVLNTNKTLRIEVGAHTDSKGSAAANLKLSEMRAKTVQQYILNAGIPPARIIWRGYGETQLLNHCTDTVECSETEHAQNRRIEFKILGEQNTQ